MKVYEIDWNKYFIENVYEKLQSGNIEKKEDFNHGSLNNIGLNFKMDDPNDSDKELNIIYRFYY